MACRVAFATLDDDAVLATEARNSDRARGDSAEAEYGGDDRDNEENQRIL